LHEKSADFDYGAASARLAEAAAQLRTVQQIRKKFGG
ncbi:F0F1 ATP synthase subunit epsilon, partial [Pseudomonas sp. NPDC087803]